MVDPIGLWDSKLHYLVIQSIAIFYCKPTLHFLGGGK